VNELLVANEEVVERARTHVGNLAHALKTPLSVLHNEARTTNDAFASKVGEQVAIMRQQVDHHLERARVAARANILGASTDVAPVLTGIVRALEKIYIEKAIAISVVCPSMMKFRGEKQDLEEMVGNLLDNAFKWASGEISVDVSRLPGASDGEAMIEITVDDDGPGLTDVECEAAMKRGRRLDETKPGSGLGLSIVGDIAAMYKGTFRLGRARAGGLHARLTLPALAPA
jgi:signal transduction histidine kinase